MQDGASEIDIVLNRTLALQGNWKGISVLYILIGKMLKEKSMITIPCSALQQIDALTYDQAEVNCKMQSFQKEVQYI